MSTRARGYAHVSSDGYYLYRPAAYQTTSYYEEPRYVTYGDCLPPVRRVYYRRAYVNDYYAPPPCRPYGYSAYAGPSFGLSLSFGGRSYGRGGLGYARYYHRGRRG